MTASTVLLIDLEGIERDQIQRQLKTAGYQVLVTDTGYEAVKLMSALQIDVIVLEWGIRDWAAAEVLYQAVKWPERIPVILYTSHKAATWDYSMESVDLKLLKSPDITPLFAGLRAVLSESRTYHEWNDLVPAELADSPAQRNSAGADTTWTNVKHLPDRLPILNSSKQEVYHERSA